MEDAKRVLYIFMTQPMTSSCETAGMLVADPPMVLNNMETLSAVFSSGASVIHTASYGPSVKKPWWNFTPHDSAVFMWPCIVIAFSLVGAWVFFTRVTNHIVADLDLAVYIRRHQNHTKIMRSWFASVIVAGVALFVFVVAVLGVFDASIVALLIVMTVILVNNASKPKTTVKQ